MHFTVTKDAGCGEQGACVQCSGMHRASVLSAEIHVAAYSVLRCRVLYGDAGCSARCSWVLYDCVATRCRVQSTHYREQ